MFPCVIRQDRHVEMHTKTPKSHLSFRILSHHDRTAELVDISLELFNFETTKVSKYAYSTYFNNVSCWTCSVELGL